MSHFFHLLIRIPVVDLRGDDVSGPLDETDFLSFGEDDGTSSDVNYDIYDYLSLYDETSSTSRKRRR